MSQVQLPCLRDNLTNTVVLDGAADYNAFREYQILIICISFTDDEPSYNDLDQMNLLPNGFLDMLMAAPPPPHVPPVHRPEASQPQVADVDNETPQQAADVDIPPPQQATDVDNPPPQQATDVVHPPPQKVTGPEHPAAADVIAANADKSGIVIF